jgi:hypothetical protein
MHAILHLVKPDTHQIMLPLRSQHFFLRVFLGRDFAAGFVAQLWWNVLGFDGGNFRDRATPVVCTPDRASESRPSGLRRPVPGRVARPGERLTGHGH